MPFLTILKLSLPSPASKKNTLRTTLVVQGVKSSLSYARGCRFHPWSGNTCLRSKHPNTNQKHCRNRFNKKYSLKKTNKNKNIRHSPDFVTTAYTPRVSQCFEGESGHFPADVSSSAWGLKTGLEPDIHGFVPALFHIIPLSPGSGLTPLKQAQWNRLWFRDCPIKQRVTGPEHLPLRHFLPVTEGWTQPWRLGFL